MSRRRNRKKQQISNASLKPINEPNELKKGVQASVSHVQAESFSGPLPPPKILQDYENILVGSADRIITMAENQSNHRMELEKNVINSDIKLANRGQIFGFILAIALSLIGAIFIYIGKDIGGLITLISGITLLVSTFIGSSKKKAKNLDAKRNNINKSIM